MFGRVKSLLLSLLLVLLLVMVDIVSEFVTSGSGQSGAGSEFRLLHQWSVPLLGFTVLLLIAGTAWQHLIEHPATKGRRWTSARPPFPGLEAFTEDDTEVFFGRDAEIQELLGRLRPMLPDRAHRFVALIGPSGTGKSSLVQAGLLARLGQRRSDWVVVPAMVPGHHPTKSLARSLAAVLPSTTLGTVEAEFATAAGVLRWVEELRVARGGRAASVLLVIDQAEELLTSTSRQECHDFLGLLRSALREDPKLWVVATLRSEFLTGMLQIGAGDLFRNPLIVGPLSREALFEVIEKPALRAGLTFAPGVVTELVDDAGSGDALPLLAYTLEALYLQFGSGGIVTAEGCQGLGGVTGALARQADQVVSELRAIDVETPVLATMLRFVTLNENEPTRRRVPRDLLPAAERQVVDAFIGARLLTSDVEDEIAVVGVAHEALFRQWAPLRQAIEAAAEELRQRAQLERWAQEWADSGRRDSYLLRDERLRIALQWAENSDDVAELPLVVEFLELSRSSDVAAMERLSDLVAKQALTAIESDPEQGILLALAAVEECAHTPVAHRALLAALGASRIRGVFRGHEDAVHGVAWSPHGRLLATSSNDHTVRIWDADSRTELTVLHGHQSAVQAVTWSPVGPQLATAGDDGTVRVWDADSGAELTVLHGHQNTVRSVAWSPDGRRLATGSNDRTARIWEAGSGTELAVLHGHQNTVRSVAWSPDGRRLATVSRDTTGRIWDVDSGAELLVLRSHQDAVRGVSWSPDGRRLVTGSNDRTVRIWDALDGNELAVLRGHQNGICAVDWSPDGQQLATASFDGTARVWDVDTGIELTVLRGHHDTVQSVAWSPDSQQLATASLDRTARIWEIHSRTELVALHAHLNTVWRVAWSPDGRQLATASHDRKARIWEVDSGTEVVSLDSHKDTVWSVAWSPDGQQLATASEDRTARIWEVDGSAEVVALRGHQGTVWGAAWSPDSQQVVTGADDYTARIWEVNDGTEVAVLSAHQDTVRDVAWSPDSRWLATCSDDRTARIWNARDGAEQVVLCGHDDWVWGVTWAPHGQQLATASEDRTARIWQVDTGTELTVLHGHQHAVWGVAWSPDGKRLATASLDRTARIWDVDSGVELAVLRGHRDGVRSVAWSPDGKRLATGSDDRTARIWDLTQVWDAATAVDALITMARTRVFRALTDDERRSVMLPERASGASDSGGGQSP